MENNDEYGEFVSKMKTHRKVFRLTQKDVAELMGVKQYIVSRFESNSKLFDESEMKLLSGIYDKTYSDIMAPNYKIPKYEELPLKTQQKIDERNKLGVKNQDFDKNLGKKLDSIIYGTGILHIPATGKEILNSFDEDDAKLFTVSVINKYLADKPRSNRVVRIVGEKKDGMIVYILKEFYDSWKEAKDITAKTNGIAEKKAAENKEEK